MCDLSFSAGKQNKTPFGKRGNLAIDHRHHHPDSATWTILTTDSRSKPLVSSFVNLLRKRPLQTAAWQNHHVVHTSTERILVRLCWELFREIDLRGGLYMTVLNLNSGLITTGLPYLRVAIIASQFPSYKLGALSNSTLANMATAIPGYRCYGPYYSLGRPPYHAVEVPSGSASESGSESSEPFIVPVTATVNNSPRNPDINGSGHFVQSWDSNDQDMVSHSRAQDINSWLQGLVAENHDVQPEELCTMRVSQSDTQESHVKIIISADIPPSVIAKIRDQILPIANIPAASFLEDIPHPSTNPLVSSIV